MTLREEIKKWMLNRIENENYQLTDRNSCLELRKQCAQALNLKKGSFGLTNEILHEILREKNFVIPDIKNSDTIGNLNVTFENPQSENETTASFETQQETVKAEPSQQVSKETQIPSQQSQPQKKILDPKVEQENIDILTDGLAFIGEIYAGLGIIKNPSGTSFLKVDEMNAEGFKTESKKLATRLGGYLYRRNLSIPWIIELITILGTAIVLLVIPLIKSLFMKTEKDQSENPENKKETETKGNEKDKNKNTGDSRIWRPP